MDTSVDRLFNLICSDTGLSPEHGKHLVKAISELSRKERVSAAMYLEAVEPREKLLLRDEGVRVLEVVADRAIALETEENDLAESLANYTNPDHPEYDPEFDKQIRTLRPDWFDDTSREVA